MEETLAKLSLDQQKFVNVQIKTTMEFQTQKEQIFINDRKKETYLKQKDELEVRNTERREEIKEKQDKIRVKKDRLEELRSSIKKYQIYQEFLRDVRKLSDDFGPAELDEFSVMSILERYKGMEKKKHELAEVHRRIGIEKEARTKSILEIRKTHELKMLHYGRQTKELKQKIDILNEENVQLQSELEGQLNQNDERQRELAQVIFSIRGLYLSISGDDKAKTTIEMLARIKEQRKKLKEYLELYQKKTEQAKKMPDKKQS